MRLRPTQFVFLLLLLCSVQLGEDYTRQLTAEAPALLSASTSRPERTRHLAPDRVAVAHPQASAASTALATATFQRALPAMTPPASSAAAVAHHTSLLRA